MANSKFEYVRSFEQPDLILPNTWIVVRIDGRGFTKLTTKHGFTKPNDKRALDLMNAAAEAVMKELPDLVIAYGNSDEFSFAFHKNCTLFERRASKLMTTIVSTFTSYYTFLWSQYLPDKPLTPPLPSFDGRATSYPSDENLRDYFSWRQTDCHINNLYNTTFWALVQQGGMKNTAAEQELKGTVSSDKNEILFSRFGINYNNEPDMFKKGSVLYRDYTPSPPRPPPSPPRKTAPTELAHPIPRRNTRPSSQPLEPSPHFFKDWTESDAATPRGPTFLSTSTTPSPPPSPPPTSTMPLPRQFVPVSSPTNFQVSANGSKHAFSTLTPLPLPPPTLKPSTKPPKSLTPPNPTAYTISPQTSPVQARQMEIPTRTTSNATTSPKGISHSASASLTLPPSTREQPKPVAPAPSSSKPTLKHRSPSLSLLDASPPKIPLRISSIPLNNKPRKLSLPSQRSFSALPPSDPAGPSTPKRSSPPLRTMKELPSPPVEDAATEPTLDPAQVEARVPRYRAHARITSEPTPAQLSSFPEPPTSHPNPHPNPLSSHPLPHPHHPSSSSTSKPQSQSQSKSKSKGKSRAAEQESWAAETFGGEGGKGGGAPSKETSRTQRERERKKRQKARIVVEHVDVIRDGFWEGRPWILGGGTG